MKCKLSNFWWQYPKKLVCEGSIITWGEIEKLEIKRNGHGFWEICNGDIEIKISAEDEPYFGGSNAVLAVEFWCNKCGNGYYPNRNLPNSDELNIWLNNILKETE